MHVPSRLSSQNMLATFIIIILLLYYFYYYRDTWHNQT